MGHKWSLEIVLLERSVITYDFLFAFHCNNWCFWCCGYCYHYHYQFYVLFGLSIAAISSVVVLMWYWRPLYCGYCLQCFATVDWAAGRASGS